MHRGRGLLPAVDLEAVAAVAAVVRELVAAGLVLGAHDVSRGGVATALAEMAVRSGVRAAVRRGMSPTACDRATATRPAASVIAPAGTRAS